MSNIVYFYCISIGLIVMLVTLVLDSFESIAGLIDFDGFDVDVGDIDICVLPISMRAICLSSVLFGGMGLLLNPLPYIARNIIAGIVAYVCAVLVQTFTKYLKKHQSEADDKSLLKYSNCKVVNTIPANDFGSIAAERFGDSSVSLTAKSMSGAQKSDAQREQDEKTSENVRAGEQAKIKARTEVREAEKEQAVKQAQYDEEAAKAQAKAALAGEIQTKITEKDVIQAQSDAELVRQQRQKEITEAEIQVQIAQAQKNTELAEQQAVEKEKKLLSEVVKPAEANRKKQEQEAEASKFNAIKKAEAEAEKKRIDAQADADAITATAVAQADAIRKKAEAEADAISKKGSAEAEATRAKLLAEAEGLERRAEAMQKMNQAGVTQMIIDKLPEIAGAIAKPMEQIDKISIIGGADGVAQVTDYVPTALAKVVETVKETTGFDLTDVMKANTIQAQTENNVNITTEKK